jgi:signal transduction histidine kinase
LGTILDTRESQPLKEANRLIAQISGLFSDTDDLNVTLTALAEFIAQQLADLCVIHLLDDNNLIDQVALAPVEKSKLQTVFDWLKNHLLLDDICGLPAALNAREALLVTDMASEHWAGGAKIRSYMVVPFVAHSKIFGAITLATAGSDRSFDQSDLDLFENLAFHISSYLDKARLSRESAQLKAKLEQRVSERTSELRTAVSQLKQSEATIQTQFRISNKLNATLDVDNILDELAQEAIRIVNGESGFAGLRTADGMSMRKYFHNGIAMPFEYTWPIGKGIPGWVLKYKVPYGTSDAATDPMMIHHLSINQDVRSVICTPILDSAGEVLGYFDIRNKKGAEGFTVSDQEMLMALAPIASIAIQNALAYQQRLITVGELKETSKQLHDLAANLESVREEERTQIARELHDQLGQALTAMKFDLAWLTDQLKQKDPLLAQKTKTVTEQMDTTIKTVRRIATELRPGMLDDLGLAASIEWQARDFGKRAGIMCAVSVPYEDLHLTRSQSVALFRIFQEALTNVARHASAQHVKVRLTSTPEAVTLQVHDDGRGIQTQEIAGLHSLGLLGMKERATRLGGNFTIRGAPGSGTVVTVTIPVNQSE